MREKAFHILTIGWEPSFIEYFAVPIAALTDIQFTHALVGDSRRLPLVQKALPGIDFVVLSKANDEPLPTADYGLLASLESVGVPTIRSMVQGDRVLRNRPESEALGYATLLARRIRRTLCELQPNIVLAAFDSLHSSLSLAVAKSLGMPWVTMSFSAIPQNLTAFCKGMTPNTLVPITRPIDDLMRRQAEETLANVRSNRQQVLAYRPPASFQQRAKQFLLHLRNFVIRAAASKTLGYDRFLWPTAPERVVDIVRRSINELRLPAARMVGSPPNSRFAYFPLHMAPESSVDTWAPFYQDQLALVVQLSLSLPAELEFVVKLHFGDPDNYTRRVLLQLMKLPRLRIARPDASGHAFLKQATFIFGIQGTACLEAALLGKPVLLFGDSPYQYFPRSERAKRPEELHQQILRMLEAPAPTDKEILEAFTDYMSRYMPGRINDWSRPIEEDELDRLADCFRSLRSYVEAPGNRANWYHQSPFDLAATPIMAFDRARADKSCDP